MLLEVGSVSRREPYPDMPKSQLPGHWLQLDGLVLTREKHGDSGSSISAMAVRDNGTCILSRLAAIG